MGVLYSKNFIAENMPKLHISTTIGNASLRSSRLAYNRMTQKLINLPRSSNKSM